NLLRAIYLSEHALDAGEQLLDARQSQLKRHGIRAQVRGQLQRRGGDDDGAALGAKLFRDFAQAAADAVVVAITRKIFEKKDSVALDQREIRQRLLGTV